MARQAHDAHVEGEVLAPELRADPGLPRRLEQVGLELDVAEGLALLVAPRGQPVERLRRGQLDRLQARLGRGPADDEGEVIRRARGGAQRLHLLGQVLHEAHGVEQRLRLLEEAGLVRRAPSLRDHQEAVLHPVRRVDVDLGGQVRPRVGLVVHREGNGLRVAEALLRVGVEDAAGEVLLVAAARPHPLALLPHDRGGARVLAHRQHEAGRDLGVAQEGERHAPVVLRGLGVVEDGGELRQVPGPVEKRHVAEGLPRDEGEGLGGDLQDLLVVEPGHGHEIGGDVAIGRLLLRDREGLHVAELGHVDLLGWARSSSGRCGAGEGSSRMGCRQRSQRGPARQWRRFAPIVRVDRPEVPA